MPDLMLYEYRDLSDAELKEMLCKELKNIITPHYTEKLNRVSNKYASTGCLKTYKLIPHWIRHLRSVSNFIWLRIINNLS